MKMKKIYHEQNDNINIYVKYGNSIVTKQEETISVPDKKKVWQKEEVSPNLVIYIF